MAKLPSVTAKQVVRVAVACGFVFDRQKGSHAVYTRFEDGRRVVIPLHSGKDLKPGTLRGIVADLGLTPEEFRGLL